MRHTLRAACTAALVTLLVGSGTMLGTAPATATAPDGDSVDVSASDPVLQVGESRSGRVTLGAGARQCHTVTYSLRQVDPTHIRLRYTYHNGCTKQIKIAWQTRNERYPGDGAGGVRVDRGWECYNCRSISGSVQMYDPKGIQPFEAATLYLGLTGTNIIGEIPIGDRFYA